jgi:hypothetical protein
MNQEFAKLTCEVVLLILVLVLVQLLLVLVLLGLVFQCHRIASLQE